MFCTVIFTKTERKFAKVIISGKGKKTNLFYRYKPILKEKVTNIDKILQELSEEILIVDELIDRFHSDSSDEAKCYYNLENLIKKIRLVFPITGYMQFLDELYEDRKMHKKISNIFQENSRYIKNWALSIKKCFKNIDTHPDNIGDWNKLKIVGKLKIDPKKINKTDIENIQKEVDKIRFSNERWKERKMEGDMSFLRRRRRALDSFKMVLKKSKLNLNSKINQNSNLKILLKRGLIQCQCYKVDEKKLMNSFKNRAIKTCGNCKPRTGRKWSSVCACNIIPSIDPCKNCKKDKKVCQIEISNYGMRISKNM